MASRFVSGGAIDAATGAAIDLKPTAVVAGNDTPEKAAPAAKPRLLVRKPVAQAAATHEAMPTSTAEPPPSATPARKAEWAAVEKQLEAERQRRAEARKAAQSAGGETSLYEALQANKAAKQAAFEEQHKLKNQFRALDEDEIEFLDGLAAEARAAEARAKAEMAAGLDAFRAAQGCGGGPYRKGKGTGTGTGTGDDEDGDGGVNDGAELIGETAWAVGRKRKRRTDNSKTAFPNLKRKGSTGDKEGTEDGEDRVAKAEKEKEPPKQDETRSRPATGAKAAAPAAAAAPASAPKAKVALGLADYGSDEDSD
ncbi:hypothetical protein SCUCBS95973_009297 [Sporothrix curviconia]|uniref:FAM192A/Fyv6 N-terminal domain-containing protein n=1 Tax=Sporothrix curviconia TaxID=1260050 RepID=A0ABP0CTS6_9PEZI